MAVHVRRRVALGGTQRVIKTFVDEYRASPELWDPRNDHYSNKRRRVEAQDRLLTILRRMDSGATRIDVRKKINTFRSNFNKKVGLVKAAEAEGRVYHPKSWLYHELRFLETIKRPEDQNESFEVESEEGNICVEEVTDDMTDQIKFEISYPPDDNYIEVGGNQEIVAESPETDLNQPDEKKQRVDFCVGSSSTVQRRPRAKAKTRGSNDRLKASSSSATAIEPVALVWSSKLQSLQPTQRILAEKAINDILFEATMNHLQKGPMVINTGLSSVSYAEDEGFHVAQEEFVEYASSDDREEC